MDSEEPSGRRGRPNPINAAFPVHDHPPPLRAKAGADQCRPSGAVILVGGGEYADGSAQGLSYRWSWDGGESDRAGLSFEAPDGVHVLTLEVTSPDGLFARDTVVVRIGDEPGCGCAIEDRGRPAALAVAFFVALRWSRRRRECPRPRPNRCRS
jgi:MYXO-CTERM domain-containing protein